MALCVHTNNIMKQTNTIEKVENMSLFSTANKKVIWITVAAIAAFLIVLMIIGTFLDYEIAHWVGVERFSFFYITFGMTMEALGFLPAILVDASLLAVLFLYVKRKRFKVLTRAGCIAFLAGGVYCAIFWTLANHDIRIHASSSIHHGVAGTLSMLAGAALSFPFIALFKKLPRVTLRRLIYILLIGAVMAILANSISGLMQATWGRYRFYAIVRYDIPFFSRWYNPMGRGGTAEGFGSTSFPSLHATSVTSMIMVMLVAWTLGQHKNKERWAILWFITATMLAFVPLSRMVLKWHFLTDVVFSLFIGLVSFVVGILVIDFALGKKMLKFINDTQEDAESAIPVTQTSTEEESLQDTLKAVEQADTVTA